MRSLLTIITIACFTFFIISCKKDTISKPIPPGTYRGTFQRSSSTKISNVTLQFSSGNFEGQSQYSHYPDICKGSFSGIGDTASFSNSCVYTADFDWSYILSGKFTVSSFGDSLTMTRIYRMEFAFFYDTYKLKKQ